MVRPPRVRLLLMVVGCLALAAALVPAAAAATPVAADAAADTAIAVVHPAQTSINDTASTRRIQLMAGGLAVLGIGLIGVTVWFWRSTRPDPESLAPLEMMGRRRWRRLDTIEQRHRLDDVRAHLNDDAAEAARETVAPLPVAEAVPEPAPAPVAASPSSPDVAVPAAVVAGGAEPDDKPASAAPAAGNEASGDEVPAAEDAVVEASEVDVSAADGEGDDVGGDEVSGEHAKVHGDPLVRAMEKDAGAS